MMSSLPNVNDMKSSVLHSHRAPMSTCGSDKKRHMTSDGVIVEARW